MNKLAIKSDIEKLLYLTLLLVFIGVGIAIYAAIVFGSKLDSQVQELKEVSKRQAETIEELRAGVDEIKEDNRKNTDLLISGNARIECLVNILITGDTPATDCPKPQLPNVNSMETAKPAISPPPLTPQPAPTKKSFNQSIKDFVKSIRGK